MKITKKILAEMIKEEILSERIKGRDRVNIRKLKQHLDDGDREAFLKLFKKRFRGVTAEDYEKYPELLDIISAAHLRGSDDGDWRGLDFTPWLIDIVGVEAAEESEERASADPDLVPAELTQLSTADSATDAAAAQIDSPDQFTSQIMDDLRAINYLSSGSAGDILKRGSSNRDAVRSLQRVLLVRLDQNGLGDKLEAMKAASKDGTGVDGLYGRRTKEAVEALQRHYGIQVDGVVGRQTYLSLIANEAAGKPSEPGRRPVVAAAAAEVDEEDNEEASALQDPVLQVDDSAESNAYGLGGHPVLVELADATSWDVVGFDDREHFMNSFESFMATSSNGEISVKLAEMNEAFMDSLDDLFERRLHSAHPTGVEPNLNNLVGEPEAFIEHFDLSDGFFTTTNFDAENFWRYIDLHHAENVEDSLVDDAWGAIEVGNIAPVVIIELDRSENPEDSTIQVLYTGVTEFIALRNALTNLNKDEALSWQEQHERGRINLGDSIDESLKIRFQKLAGL